MKDRLRAAVALCAMDFACTFAARVQGAGCPTGTLSSPIVDNIQELLSNVSVLATGGTDGIHQCTAAQLYNPVPAPRARPDRWPSAITRRGLRKPLPPPVLLCSICRSRHPTGIPSRNASPSSKPGLARPSHLGRRPAGADRLTTRHPLRKPMFALLRLLRIGMYVN